MNWRLCSPWEMGAQGGPPEEPLFCVALVVFHGLLGGVERNVRGGGLDLCMCLCVWAGGAFVCMHVCAAAVTQCIELCAFVAMAPAAMHAVCSYTHRSICLCV